MGAAYHTNMQIFSTQIVQNMPNIRHTQNSNFARQPNKK